MSDKTGKPYENLTQVIFQSIHDQTEIPNLKVERNVSLQGKTARHQIDVYWKFEAGGVPHEVIVQAKDWQKPVDQLHLLAFSKILDDLPGQPRGIFVTRTGYQQGAKEFGLAHGILLYELREADYPQPPPMTAGGWALIKLVRMPLQGLITSEEPDVNAGSAIALGFEMEVFTPNIYVIKFETSTSWLKSEYPTEDTELLSTVTLPTVLPRARIFFDAKGEVIGNLGSVTEEIVQSMKKDTVETREVNHAFEPAVFIDTGYSPIPRIKVTSVLIRVEIKRTHGVVRFKMSNFPQLVMHQLNSDKAWWFAATPKVISKLSKTKKQKRKGKPKLKRGG